jgi:hypothetical protein
MRRRRLLATAVAWLLHGRSNGDDRDILRVGAPVGAEPELFAVDLLLI